MAALPLSRKIAYAAGGLGMNLPNLVISPWIFKRYVPGDGEALVPVALFSTIFLLGRVTDGVSDPLIAWWSDRLRSPRGRRLPFIAAAMLPLAAVFAVVGVIIEGLGWPAMGGIVAVLLLVSFAPTLLFIREQPRSEQQQPEARVSLMRWVRLTLRNRPFLLLVTATSCYWFGLNLLIMLVPYHVQDRLGLAEGAVTLVMGPFLLMNTVFFVVFNALAKRHGKFPLFAVTVGGTALTAPLLSAVGLLPGSGLAQTAVAMALIGVPVAGFMMLPYALLADVVDHDEQLTGQRREAIYFGVQAVFQKLTVGLSVFVFGMVVLGGEQQVVDLVGLRAVPFVAAASFVVGLVVFLRYPLREGADRVRLVR